MTDMLPRLRVPLPEDRSLDPAGLFTGVPEQVWLEIGFGAGEHLSDQAALRPDVGFIGCEPFVNGVATLLVSIRDRGLENVRIFDEDVRQLLPVLPEASIGRAFLLFPDPWPKTRHHNRRFINQANLDLIAHVLEDGAEFRVASDHMDYVRWGLSHLTRHPAFDWQVTGPEDWRRRPDDWCPTRYEKKALAKGGRCVYLRFQRRPRATSGGAGTG